MIASSLACSVATRRVRDEPAVRRAHGFEPAAPTAIAGAG
jgi:hypothetical protein